MKRTALILSTALLLASCASMQAFKDRRDVETISQLINSGNSAKLISISRHPFLLDQEILVLEKDMNSFWTEIVGAGFTVEEAELERGVPLTEESYREFYDSMEVKTFFKKYLPHRTRLLELETGKGQKILLLVETRLFTPQNRLIYGFKGPF